MSLPIGLTLVRRPQHSSEPNGTETPLDTFSRDEALGYEDDSRRSSIQSFIKMKNLFGIPRVMPSCMPE